MRALTHEEGSKNRKAPSDEELAVLKARFLKKVWEVTNQEERRHKDAWHNAHPLAMDHSKDSAAYEVSARYERGRITSDGRTIWSDNTSDPVEWYKEQPSVERWNYPPLENPNPLNPVMEEQLKRFAEEMNRPAMKKGEIQKPQPKKQARPVILDERYLDF